MKLPKIRLLLLYPVLIGVAITSSASPARADKPVNDEFRAQFFDLCDLAAATVNKTNNRAPFFVDSYAVRALCVAYDMTGNQKYFDACRAWSDQMVKYQEDMIPEGAYYMHYNRKPGQTNGDWFVADSSSIGMALLATSARCNGAERERLLNSAKKFADLVMSHYVKSGGGVSDGLWSETSDAWWNSTALFGSFSFNLYANTGNNRYLDTALNAVDWLNHWDLTKKQPFPLSLQGPAMIFYVMECYSAGWPYLSQDDARKQAALAKISWCLRWATDKQQKSVKRTLSQSFRAPRTLTKLPRREKIIMQGRWPISKGWGMKMGGLPFHEYIFSQYLPADGKLTAEGDAEIQRLAPIVFNGKPKFDQLSVFMMMSYAERLDPGVIYKAVK